MFIPCIVILEMLDLLVFDEAAPGADAKDERRKTKEVDTVMFF